MKQIYINHWLAFAIIVVVGVAATWLIVHTISVMNAQALAYASLLGN